MGEPPPTFFKYMGTLINPVGGAIRLVGLRSTGFKLVQAGPSAPKVSGRERFMAAQEAANRNEPKPTGSLVALAAPANSTLKGRERFIAAQDRINGFDEVKRKLDSIEHKLGIRPTG